MVGYSRSLSGKKMAIILACLSAVIHALWNLVGKKWSTGSEFYLLANLSCVILLCPVVFLHGDLIPLIFRDRPVLVLVSILAQISYMWLLSRAYGEGDMSFIYPIARTLPVPLIFCYELISQVSWQEEWVHFLGVLLICMGVIVICSMESSKARLLPIIYALLIGVAISIYSVLDHVVLKSIVEASNASKMALCLVYMFILEGGVVLGLGPRILWSSSSRHKLFETFRDYKGKSFIMGAGIVASYVVALLAYTYTDAASIVVALRQLSIPLGFILGLYILREKSHALKWIGMVMICLGLGVFGIP